MGGAIYGTDNYRLNEKDREEVADFLTEIFGKEDKKWTFAGSSSRHTKKKEFGDIDAIVGLSNEQIIRVLEKNKFYNYTVIKGIKLLTIGFTLSTGITIQVDLMSEPDGDIIEKKKFLYSPALNESQYKGLYRNIILMLFSKFKLTEGKEPEIGEVYKRYWFDVHKGFFQGEEYITNISEKTGRPIKPRRVKIEKNFVTKNYNEVIKILFNGKIKPEESMAFESLWGKIVKLYPKSFVKKIAKNAVYSLEKQKKEVPLELRKWS